MSSGAAGQHFPVPGSRPDPWEEHEADCDCSACEAERAAQDDADAYLDRCRD